jgi:hypothetical protein
LFTQDNIAVASNSALKAYGATWHMYDSTKCGLDGYLTYQDGSALMLAAKTGFITQFFASCLPCHKPSKAMCNHYGTG